MHDSSSASITASSRWLWRGLRIAVIDMGGGTLEVTIVQSQLSHQPFAEVFRSHDADQCLRGGRQARAEQLLAANFSNIFEHFGVFNRAAIAAR